MKKNIIIILGAGSSVDFGLPLSTDVFYSANEKLSFKQEHKIECEKLEKYISQVEGVMQTIFANLPENKKEFPPFEEILTFLWNSGDKESFSGIKKQDAFNAFVKMMGLTYAASHGFVGTEHVIEKKFKYEKYIKSLVKSGANITFLSLNYDILLDSFLKSFKEQENGFNFNYGLTLYDIRTGDEVNEDEGTSLFKPHGSLNLSSCPTCNKFLYFEDNILTPIEHQRDWCICPFCKKSSIEPLIIPPLYNKKEFIDTPDRLTTENGRVLTTEGGDTIVVEGIFYKYRQQIDAKIINALKKTDEIMIIGYSLPNYDFDFKCLLLSGLMQNKNRGNIPVKIITKDDEPGAERLRKRFQYLAGETTITYRHGFYEYIKRFPEYRGF
ncbi:hypothetical protein ACFL5E_01755 [Candidatus Omnitrophota bacterium]